MEVKDIAILFEACFVAPAVLRFCSRHELVESSGYGINGTGE